MAPVATAVVEVLTLDLRGVEPAGSRSTMFKTVKSTLEQALGLLPRPLAATLKVRALGLTKIPLLAWVRPRVVQIDERRCEVCIPLRRRTKNHLGSMYFGALMIGADLAGGLIGWKAIEDSGEPIALVFKDVQADFKRRAEGDVHFACEQGPELRDLIQRAIASGQREEHPVEILARVPSSGSDEVVARFVLTLSIKLRKRRS